MRDLELHLFIDCFPEMYPENEVATAITSTLKGALDRKVGGGWKKGLEVDFSAERLKMATIWLVWKRKKIPVVTVLMRCKG